MSISANLHQHPPPPAAAMAMDSVLLRHPQAAVRFRAFTFSASIKQQRLTTLSLCLPNPAGALSLKAKGDDFPPILAVIFDSAEPHLAFRPEVSVGRPLILCLNNHKHSRAQFVTSCINGSKGARSPRTSSGRTVKGAKGNQPESSSDGKPDNNTADQEEIISLFRRIQSSIAKGESEDSKKKKRSSGSRRDDKPVADSVLDIIHSSRKSTRDKASSKGGSKPMPRRRGLPKRELEVEVEDIQTIENFKLTRPPSNFVKRSPIPFSSAPRGKDLLLTSEVSVSPAVSETSVHSRSQKLEEMKLAELKELAKSRGVKGYSKLKKKELVELLRS